MYSQSYSNLRKQTIVLSDSVRLDTLSIVPGSEIIRNLQQHIVADSLYHINFSNSKIYTKSKILKKQSVEITYRVFPFNFSQPYPKIPTQINDTLPRPYINFYKTPNSSTGSEAAESKLQINGNISRGISTGNSQNMVVNSNLNLQLSGEIAPGLFIEAALSDKSIPIQPDGYTQQIQEFDQVYIRIFDSIKSLQMGDVEINASNSHFLKFNRRILGGNFTHQKIPISKSVSAKSQVSAAVSKGNFNRIEYLGTEGVQGPYPLKGANNETYIIILAGTENVYLDGVLLERGENSDYVMNYNTAELTFTTKHFITKDSRIIAEFEYSDKNYNRFLFYTQNEIRHKKGSFAIQYFAEGDAKNQPINQLLTDEHKNILADAGNDPLKAIVPNYDSVAYDNNLVLYKMMDTLSNGILYDSILVFSIHPDSAFYQAGFALVGENKGNYLRDISLANGKVYKWVAPVNSLPQGNYEPVQLLIAPQKQQMVVAKSTYTFSDQTHALIELAYSEKNENTFADKNTTSTKGFAIKNFIEHKIPLQQNNIVLNFAYEMAQKNFSTVERYRNAEFNRDWNISSPILSDEHLLSATAALKKKNTTQFSLVSEHLNYGLNYKGYKNTANTHFTIYNFTLSGKASLLNSKTSQINTQFYRHIFKLTRPVWKLKLGLQHDFENNIQKNILNDSIILPSKKYSLSEAFISNADNAKNTYSLAYKNRIDFLPFQNKLKATTETNDVVFATQIGSGNIQRLKATAIWRELKVKNADLVPTVKNEQNLLARIDHQLKLNKNALTFFTFYEIGTGLETRKEYSYIEVAPGQGIYVWVDYNNNDIPELNEFEISPFPEEANYLKIYTPTNNYIKVYALKLNETIKLDPTKIWRNEKGLKKIISLFSNTLTFRAQQKHTQNDVLARINPLPGYVNDTAQMNRNVSFRNTLSFNRVHPKFGADYSYRSQNQKNLQANGFDVSKSKAHQLKIRWNITSEILLANQSDLGWREYNSEFFSEKDYSIASIENKINLQWQPTPKFRASVIYQIKNKTNELGNEIALLQEAGPEIKINAPKQGMISAKIALIINDYNGDTTSPVAYTMLEGYQPGENYRWSLSFSRNVNEFLRVNLSYNGRKPADSSTIHTGQFSVSAYF